MLQIADFISCEIRRKTYSAVSNFYARAAKALEMVVSHVGRKKKKGQKCKRGRRAQGQHNSENAHKNEYPEGEEHLLKCKGFTPSL